MSRKKSAGKRGGTRRSSRTEARGGSARIPTAGNRAAKRPNPGPSPEEKRESTSKRAATVVGDWRRVNRHQLGALMGVHPDTVTDYSRAGMPVIEAGGFGKEGVYDAVDCLNWARQTQGKNAKDVAQVRALEASAKLNENKLKREAGRLVDVDEVIRAGQQYTKAWTAKVRGFARRLVQAGIIDRSAAEAVTEVCRELLIEISDWRTLEAVEKAADTEETPAA